MDCFIQFHHEKKTSPFEESANLFDCSHGKHRNAAINNLLEDRLNDFLWPKGRTTRKRGRMDAKAASLPPQNYVWSDAKCVIYGSTAARPSAGYELRELLWLSFLNSTDSARNDVSQVGPFSSPFPPFRADLVLFI